MRTLSALAVVLIFVQAQPHPLRAGILVASDGARIVALEGAPLAVGTPVVVVGLADDQQVSRATIASRVPSSDVMARHDVRGPFYEVAAEPGSNVLPDFGIVILGRPDFKRRGGRVVLHFATPPVDVRVRSCTSSEGVHLTLWAGTPLKSRRLWHTYYYLGYDVDPTCTPADTSPGG